MTDLQRTENPDPRAAVPANGASPAGDWARLALEAAGDGLWEWDVAGGRMRLDAGWAAMLGYDPVAATASVAEWQRLVHPDDLPALLDHLGDLLRGRVERLAAEHRMRLADGSWGWVLTRGRVVGRDAGGRAVRVVGTQVDIAERRRVDEVLAERGLQLDLALAAARMGTWRWDIPANQLTYSETVGPLFGLQRGQAHPTREALIAAVDPEHRPAVQAAIQDALAGERPFDVEFGTRGPDGIHRWVAMRGELHCSPDGRPSHMLGVARDVSARRQAQEALRRSEERLAGVIASAMDAIVSVDDDGLVRLFNPAAERMFGCPAAEAAGQPLVRFVPRPPATGTAAEVVELAGRRADGTEFPMEATLSRAALGGQRLVTMILRDVSERRALEEQVRDAQKMEAIGQLAGGVAHEFNNLLTAVLASLAYIRDELPDDSPAREDAAEAERAVTRAADLTRQLLAFSRRQPLAPRAVDLSALVRGAEAGFRFMLGERVALELRLEPALWAVHADSGQVEQVLLSLVRNARDAMPAGGVLTVETANVVLDAEAASRLAGLAPGHYVRLRVRDTGVGIDEQLLGHIFEPFFTTKPVGQGSGLGLASVYGTVTQAGGRVFAESEAGAGTTITILLPAAGPGGGAAERVDGAVAAGGEATILLVEDEETVRSAAAKILRRAGYVVIEARDGEAGLAAWRQHGAGVRLLVTDVRMPGLGGLELAARIEADRPGLPVIFITGYTGPGERPVGEVIEKPFTGARLLEAVSRRLAAGGPGGAA